MLCFQITKSSINSMPLILSIAIINNIYNARNISDKCKIVISILYTDLLLCVKIAILWPKTSDILVVKVMKRLNIKPKV